VGPLLGRDAAPLGELGKLVIQLIKAVATPLIYLVIVNAVLTTEIGGRSARRLVGFAMANAIFALAIGLLLSNVLHPGVHLAAAVAPVKPEDLAAYADKKVDLLKTLASYVPMSWVSPFTDNLVISIVGMALLTGFALRRVRAEQIAAGHHGYKVLEDGVAAALRGVEVVLHWVVLAVPLAVFGVVAKTVGETGFAPLVGLAWYVGVGVLGLVIHVVVTYQLWLILWVRMPLARFWAAAREPVIYAVGANSSLATLPVTLKALDKLGISRASSTLGACVGTNLNNDGILLYEGMAVLFVAQASGIVLTLPQQLSAAASCIVAAAGVAGVPEAGFISLALVLNTVGLPIELLPLLLTVDWVIARGRSVVNVLSDMMLSILIEGRAPRAR
jgi:DAACS family dicarboxylate/amino acid:cation (Na+ or H+) symporter